MWWRPKKRAIFALFLGFLAGCASEAPHPIAAALIESPSASPDPQPTPLVAEPSTPVRVMVGGDLLPHRPRLSPPSRIGAALAPLAPLFAQADVVVANYETSTGDPDAFGDAPMRFSASAAWMEEISRAHVRALTLANNHACDLGRKGLSASVAAAKALDVIALGAAEHDPWTASTLVTRDGHRVCAVAWTTIVNSPGCSKGGQLAVAPVGSEGTARVRQAVEAARAGGCDAVVAILHGGLEYVPQIRAVRGQAMTAAEAGADAVVIHHPHVPSMVEVLTTKDARRVPIFMSVGNLVSNQGESWKPTFPATQKNRHLVYMNAWTRLGVIADLSWSWATPDRVRGELTWGYHLVWTDNAHAYDRADPMPAIATRVFDAETDLAIVKRLAADRRGPTALFESPCWLEKSPNRCR
ncbi:MAG: CapA family protein [Polyangiaceae bacterium]